MQTSQTVAALGLRVLRVQLSKRKTSHHREYNFHVRLFIFVCIYRKNTSKFGLVYVLLLVEFRKIDLLVVFLQLPSIRALMTCIQSVYQRVVFLDFIIRELLVCISFDFTRFSVLFLSIVAPPQQADMVAVIIGNKKRMIILQNFLSSKYGSAKIFPRDDSQTYLIFNLKIVKEFRVTRKLLIQQIM